MRRIPHRPTDFFGPRVREVRDRPTDPLAQGARGDPATPLQIKKRHRDYESADVEKGVAREELQKQRDEKQGSQWARSLQASTRHLRRQQVVAAAWPSDLVRQQVRLGLIDCSTHNGSARDES